jgi:hypothetical protein
MVGGGLIAWKAVFRDFAGCILGEVVMAVLLLRCSLVISIGATWVRGLRRCGNPGLGLHTKWTSCRGHCRRADGRPAMIAAQGMT